jgi:hypothetical protein
MTATIAGVQPVRTFRPESTLQRKEAETVVELWAGQLWQADGNNCWRAIMCQEGVIWITQNGDVQDHVITAGEMFLVSQPGKVIVQALDSALIEVTPCLATTSFRGRFEDTIFQ